MQTGKRPVGIGLAFSLGHSTIVIGGVEALGLLSDHFGWGGGVWEAVTGINDHFGALGYAIVTAFMACWIGSALFHRWRRPDAASR